MTRPRLLDLFSGAGGCSMGYARAGFDVVGVDIADQPNYPFEFIREDALRVLDHLARHWSGKGEAWTLGYQFDAIHASPPCQDYSKAFRHMASPQPRLIEPVRAALVESGLPWVIENVVGAPLPLQSTLDERHGVELCGSMFGLRVRRHRLFECSFPIEAPRGCDHSRPAMNPHNAKGRAAIGYAPETQWRDAMGIDWMGKDETREAVPPAYTEHIGHYLLTEINARKAAA